MNRMPSRRPHYFKMTVASKDFGSSVGSAVSLGTSSVSFNNGGMFVLTTGNTQSVQYFAVAQYFSLSTLPNVTTFTSLFDRYSITKIVVRVFPLATQATQADTGNPQVPQVNGWCHSIIDHDDADIPNASDVGCDNFRQRLTYKCRNIIGTKCHSWVIKPRVAIGAFSGAFTSYANRAPGWIDSSSPAVQHYGLKQIWEVSNPDSLAYYLAFKYEVTYYLKFRDPI